MSFPGCVGASAVGVGWENDHMEPRISLITLGVADLARSYRFYREGLELPTTRGPEDGIVFFQTSGTVLALFPYEQLAADIGAGWNVPRGKFCGITLAHNVRERREVDELLAAAAAAGWRWSRRPGDGVGRLPRLFHRSGRVCVGGGLGGFRVQRRRIAAGDLTP